MARDTDLLRRLNLAGLTVTEVAGWQTRGNDTMAPLGSVDHHTAGPLRGVQPSLGVVINGRSDLAGPLCNVHGPREESLRVNLVAAGKANHAGVGVWRGITGNSHFLGLEEEHVGTTAEGLSPLRLERMVRVHAAFAFEHFTPDEVCQHWEFATPAGRKIDFVKALINPDEFRRRVAERLALMQRGAVVEPWSYPPFPGNLRPGDEGPEVETFRFLLFSVGFGHFVRDEVHADQFTDGVGNEVKRLTEFRNFLARGHDPWPVGPNMGVKKWHFMEELEKAKQHR